VAGGSASRPGNGAGAPRGGPATRAFPERAARTWTRLSTSSLCEQLGPRGDFTVPRLMCSSAAILSIGGGRGPIAFRDVQPRAARARPRAAPFRRDPPLAPPRRQPATIANQPGRADAGESMPSPGRGTCRIASDDHPARRAVLEQEAGPRPASSPRTTSSSASNGRPARSPRAGYGCARTSPRRRDGHPRAAPCGMSMSHHVGDGADPRRRGPRRPSAASATTLESRGLGARASAFRPRCAGAGRRRRAGRGTGHQRARVARRNERAVGNPWPVMQRAAGQRDPARADAHQSRVSSPG